MSILSSPADKTLDEMLAEIKDRDWNWELQSHPWRTGMHYAAVTDPGGWQIAMQATTAIEAVRPLWRLVVLGQV